MLEIKIVQPRDFINIAANGEYEFGRSRAVIEQLAELNKPPNDYAVLLDLRGAEGYATTADIYELAMLMDEHHDSFRSKVAILVPEQDSRRYANAEFFALCAENRGFRASAFTTFEDAMNWLSEIVRISGGMPTLPSDKDPGSENAPA